MKDYIVEHGRNSYRCKTGTVIASRLSQHMDRFYVNVRWDESDEVDINREMPADWDVVIGDRALVVKPASGIFVSPDAWVAWTTVRASRYMFETNSFELPSLHWAMIRRKAIQLVLIAGACWWLVASESAFETKLAGVALAAGTVGYLAYRFKKWRDLVRNINDAKASEDALHNSIPQLLQKWIGQLERGQNQRTNSADTNTNDNDQTGSGARDESASDRETSKTWWEILGVRPDASVEEIKRAGRAKLKQNHPDLCSHLSPELQEESAKITRRILAAMEEGMRRAA